MRLSLPLFICLFLLCVLACANASGSSPKASAQANPLIQGFVDALNKKSKADLEAFLNAHAASTMLAKVPRLISFADQGAPFKVNKIVSESPTAVTAALEDTNGVPITLTLNLGPDGKIASAMVAVGDSGGPVKDYSKWSDLAQLTSDIQKDSTAPGMAIAVLHDGKVEAAAAGVREIGKPDLIKADDPFSIGSIGKPLTSTLIGILVEQGKLHWDETLAEALPNTPMKAEYKTVTLEEILHHRGGIPEDPGMRRPDVVRIVNGATDPIQIRENYAKDILSRDPIGKPNEKFVYSNAGYELLGHIAEVTMKKPYEALVRDLIFKPLGMSHSYTNEDKLPADIPAGHVAAGDGPQGAGTPGVQPPAQGWQPVHFTGPIEILFAPAGGGMYCSAEDLIKFGEMHMNGLNGKDGLLKAATIQHLHAGIPEDLQLASGDKLAPSYTASMDSRLYACGWGIEAHQGIETMHMHNGSNGTMRAQLSIFPKSGVVVAAFINCGGESEPSAPLQAAIAVGQRYAKQ